MFRAKLFRRSPVKHFLFTLALVIATLSSSPARALKDPRINWERLETPHFMLIFDSRHYQLALEYATYAEQAYAAATPFFKEAPEKTVLMIDDSTDIANGFATGVPYPFVNAFPVLPTPFEAISDYGNWGLELLTHEYTHILTFEPANGLAKPLRMIFGTILRPNMVLPNWYLEGLAVHMETRLSNHGRLRSRNAMAIPRAMIEENTLSKEDISRINELRIPDALGGLRPYLLGGILWNQMVTMGGEETIGKLNDDYSRRIPFLIDAPARSRLGLDYSGLLAKSYERLTERAEEQLKAIRDARELSAQPIKQEGTFNHSPMISPDGKWMTVIARTANQDDRIDLFERPSEGSLASGEKRIVTTGTMISRASWLPDSTGFVFDKVDTYARYSLYSDLYAVDIKARKSKRLTRGQRARDPAVSPDGKRIVFVQNTAGNTRLAAIDASGDGFTVLYTPEKSQTRISRPEFINANEAVFVEKGPNGDDLLKVISLTELKTREILGDYKPLSFPRMTSEGLVFVSGRTGIDNLYLADLDLTSAKAISNVSTRAMTGEIDPKTRDLYFSKLTANGPQVFVAAKEAWRETPQQPPRTEPLIDTAWPAFTVPQVQFEPERKPYSAWPYMMPRYWMPFAYFIPGGSFFSASTSAADPAEHHAYTVETSYDTLSAAPSFGGQYTNAQTRMVTTLAAADKREYIYAGDFVRHDTLASLTGSFFLAKNSSRWKGSLSWKFAQTEYSNEIKSRQGPGVAVQYADVSQSGLEISPEKGGDITLSHTRYLPELGNTEYDVTNLLSSVYFSKWLPKRNAIQFRLNGMYAPRLPNINLGTTTAAGNYGSFLLSSDFMMRGYANNSFIAESMINTGLEYRFPITKSYRGFGTWPLFIQRWHGAVFYDAVTLDGRWYNPETRRRNPAEIGKFFSSVGAEARADMTMFYNLPVKMTLGLYYGLDPRASLGVVPFFGFSL